MTKEERKQNFYQKFNALHNGVIKLLSDYINSRESVECECLVCGYKWAPRSSTLLLEGYGCPKCHQKQRFTTESFKEKVYDMYGDEYTVLGEYINNKTKILFRHNQCGYIFEMRPNAFLQGQGCPMHKYEKSAVGRTKTHEEFVKEVYDLVGDEYTVLDTYIHGTIKIRFVHNICGSIFEMTPNAFLSGRRCPNCRSSKGEHVINNFLKNEKIMFIPQKSFDNLLGVGGGHLSYDFYLPDYNLLVEYQGVQHEIPKDHFGGQEQFDIQQEHDLRKRQYAKENNINLLEIWHYDFDKIDEILKENLNL